MNGDICTNGTVEKNVTAENFNGNKYENANRDMIYILNKIDSEYFSSNSFKKYNKNYIVKKDRIAIQTPTEVIGSTTLTGTINISTAFKALSNLTLNGDVKNTTNAVIYSKYGDIIINSSNVNLNGLIYAPFGDVKIKCDTLNLNKTVIIANNVILDSPIINANYSTDIADFVGNSSEELNIPKDEWEYMKDGNENNCPDFFENPDNWHKLKDTDSDGLPDCIEEYLGTNPNKKDTDGDMLNDYYEVFVTFTDPLKQDSDGNSINDSSEDFDKDGLSNWKEFLNKTDPYNPDCDDDGLKDGKEVNTYKTDPLNPDTDGDKLNDGDEIHLGTNPLKPDSNDNGILDCDEKFQQTLVHKAENQDSAVSQVSVSMNGTGYIKSTTTVESVMNKDILCTGVVGLVGEPFEIESTSKFDNATITFKIDKSKLGDTAFDNLMFLWYDEENNNFVELETTLNKAKSTASITTNHFSKYMIVDKQAWFDNWREIYDKYKSLPTQPSITSICVDCSGSMSGNDPNFQIADHSYSCYRKMAVEGFADAMLDNDQTNIITFDNSAKEICTFTSNKDTVKSKAKFYSSGGTNANSAVIIALGKLNGKSGNKSIILMSDGDVNVTKENINLAVENNIKIHTIGLGSGADNSSLKSYAEQTGGEFFKVTTAVGLEDIYNKLSVKNQFNFDSMSDSDGDGVPDDIEISGIPMPSGEIVYPDPNNKHSDDDGLTDGEEVGTLVRNPATSACTPDEAVEYKFYFNIKSDPTKMDTDGDGLNDFEDVQPLKAMEISEKFEKLGDVLYTVQEYDIAKQFVSKIKSIWIVKPDNRFNRNQLIEYFDCENKFNNSILIIDLTNEYEINYQIYNSYKYSNYDLMIGTLKLLIKYNKSYGNERSAWKRTLIGLYAEWEEHNLLYFIPNHEIKESAQHADLDQYANGTIFGPDIFNYYEDQQ